MRDNPTQDLSALSRDTENALNELGRIFDKETIAEQQELAAAFGEEAFRLAHNLPDDGSGRKVVIHAIIGGIMSQITGASFASGAIGAGINEAVIGEIKKIKDPGTDRQCDCRSSCGESDWRQCRCWCKCCGEWDEK